MAVRETHILLDIIADADPLRGINREMDDIIRQTRMMGRSYADLTDDSRDMMREMNMGWRNQNDAFKKFRNNLVAAEYDFFKLAQVGRRYGGTTDELIRAIDKMGLAHKRATDGMLANDDRMRQSLYRTIGTFSNMTPLAEKNAAAIARMNNPLYNVNRAGLSVVGTLNRIANNANTARFALENLGKDASMKDVNDEIQRLNKGLGAMPVVAIGAGVAAYFLYKSLWKAATGPDPSTVWAKQAEALATYRDAVRDRTREIMESWNLFENIQLEKTSSAQLTKNLQEQVRELDNWRGNLGDIAEEAGTEFATYLSQMGPQSAGEVAKIAQMTGPQLDKYVGLWREKMALSKDVATTELEKLRVSTMAKIQELQNTLTPLGLAAEKMKSTWIEAVQPMVDVFALIMVPIVNFITKIGEMIVKFNEAHPALAMMLQGIVMLIPALTLLLLPLGLGVGYVNGLRIAFGFFFRMIAPVVTFLVTMSATVWIVAAAIIALGAAFIWAWNNVAWFRDGIIAAWNWIKTNTLIAWAAIVQAVQPALQAIATFVMQKLAQIKAFWSQHGAQIMAVVSVFMAQIKGYISVGMAAIKMIFQVGWTIISNAVKIAWAAIKAAVNIGLSLISGLIAATMAAIQGDWSGAWNEIKGIAETIWHNIEAFFAAVDLQQIGRDIIQGLINGISSMAGAALDAASNIAGKIKSAVTGALDINSPSRVMFEYGGFVSEGMGLGIEDGSKFVQKSAANMAGGAIPTYTPSSPTGSVSNNRSSVTLNPTIYISGGGEDGKSVKQQVKEAFEELFDHINFLYEPEEEY